MRKRLLLQIILIVSIVFTAVIFVLKSPAENTAESTAANSSASASADNETGNINTAAGTAAAAASSDGFALPSSSQTPESPSIDISITFAGDFLIHDKLYNLAKQPDGTYDYTNLYKEIAPVMSEADFTIANLETTFAGSKAGYSGYPRFNAPESLAGTMKHLLGIDMLMTANNHCNDKGWDGIVNTIDVLDRNDILHVGTYKNKQSADKPQIVDIKGIKVSFLNYTYSLNGHALPEGKEYGVNMIDQNKIKKDAKAAREAGAEYIIYLPHWGIEYKLTESAQQRTQAKWIFENTEVDMIIGGHPHVVQPADYITVTKDGKTKTGFILYSLGNFSSSHAARTKYSDTGIVLQVSLHKDTKSGSVNINKIQYTPVALDYTPGDASDNCTISIPEAIKAYENNSSKTITASEYDLFKEYREYYRDIFSKASVSEK